MHGHGRSRVGSLLNCCIKVDFGLTTRIMDRPGLLRGLVLAAFLVCTPVTRCEDAKVAVVADDGVAEVLFDDAQDNATHLKQIL